MESTTVETVKKPKSTNYQATYRRNYLRDEDNRLANKKLSIDYYYANRESILAKRKVKRKLLKLTTSATPSAS